MSAGPAGLPAIDPLGPPPRAGLYRDEIVEVRAWRGARPRRELNTIRTDHFDVRRQRNQVHLVHALDDDELDDDLSGLLADELFRPGWLRGAEVFERLFTGIVLSSDPHPVRAWARFYRNTLDRIERSLDTSRQGAARPGHGTIADYAPVYRYAEQALAPGSVLEVGCCFGFLSLRLAAAGRAVTASDVSAGTVALLRAVAPLLGLQVATRTADAGRLPWAAGAADNVLVVHLLEHLDPRHGDRVVAEAVRVSRRRVVIAVPLEDEADETWGHVRTVSLADLDTWGARSGRPYQVSEHHGGWLVIDSPS